MNISTVHYIATKQPLMYYLTNLRSHRAKATLLAFKERQDAKYYLQYLEAHRRTMGAWPNLALDINEPLVLRIDMSKLKSELEYFYIDNRFSLDEVTNFCVEYNLDLNLCVKREDNKLKWDNYTIKPSTSAPSVNDKSTFFF